MLAWLSVWSEVHTCIWPSWCHCHSLSHASVRSILVLPFWYWFTWVVLEKGPLNRCVGVCVWNGVDCVSTCKIDVCSIKGPQTCPQETVRGFRSNSSDSPAMGMISVGAMRPFSLLTLSLRSRREHLVVCDKRSVSVYAMQSMQRRISYFASSRRRSIMASLSVSLSASISRTTLLIFKKFSARVNFFLYL